MPLLDFFETIMNAFLSLTFSCFLLVYRKAYCFLYHMLEVLSFLSPQATSTYLEFLLQHHLLPNNKIYIHFLGVPEQRATNLVASNNRILLSVFPRLEFVM